jgi:Tfp pilus assembly protein PilN
MIKINLLGVAPPPTRPAAGPPATRTFQVATFVGALVVSFAIVGIIYRVWNSSVTELEQRLKQEKLRQAELAQVKAQNERYQQRLRDLETRINTIQALQNERVGPVDLMTGLGDQVSRTSDVYLYTMTTQGDRVVLRGQTGSVDSMASFMSYLKKSASFDDVQLRQFYQDDQHNRLTYKFSLDFINKSPALAGAAGQPATPIKGSAPRSPATRRRGQ